MLAFFDFEWLFGSNLKPVVNPNISNNGRFEAMMLLDRIFGERIPENELYQRTNALCVMLAAGKLQDFEHEIRMLARIVVNLQENKTML